MKRNLKKIVLALAVLTISTSTLVQAATTSRTLPEAVRHELVMLPYYNVFDHLAYKIDGDTVTLYGQVTRPTLKTDAERVVRSIEGVEAVKNEIEVLPLSSFDDRVRLAVYRTLYSQPSLSRYSWGAVPAIHIIVKNGNVTLTGVVANEGDRNIANIMANSVSGVFSVTNNLVVAANERSLPVTSAGRPKGPARPFCVCIHCSQ
jgi:hyperosmotically inducible protein